MSDHFAPPPRPVVMLGWAVALLGAFVFAGWVIADGVGDAAAPYGEMKANTAFALLLAAVGLGLLGTSFARRRQIVAALGGLAGLIGAATLAEHVLGVDLGIDARCR